jgi:cysteinyl-tRNA synthetase
MPIHIYNSLTRKKEEFVPLNPPLANIYTCGVTVYDQSHIGHARSLYIFDTIRRYLKYRGFNVKFVRNLTDIDDKIINRANELKVNWQELIKKYIDSYYEDLKSLGISEGDFEPRATENIPDMIKYIEGLMQKGYAYESGGDVYFNVRMFAGYGKLSGQSIDEMQKGAKANPSDLKKDSLDFALWKRSKENEPFWDSPWGKGRPGWHLECSVMSQKFLRTDTLDIHAGGLDLIFPHHENEIAQAEALTGKTFAKYWIHHGLLTINGQKMSKSLGNFVTIKDFINKYKNSNFLKIFFLSTHYSHPIDFTNEKIEEAKKAYDRFRILFQKLDIKFGSRDTENLPDGKRGNIDDFREGFKIAMDDDFNTSAALAVLFNMVNECNKILDNEHDDNRFMLRYAVKVINELAEILGLNFKDIGELKSDTWVIIAIGMRKQLKQEKKYKEADEIRRTLEDKGVILEDTKDGETIWRRKL